jgi:hypothetical protein
VALLPLCVMWAEGCARGCVRLVWGVLCCMYCAVCGSVSGGGALRGVLCLCVRARQVAAFGKPDQWQFPQRGVRTVVASVSGCVALCAHRRLALGVLLCAHGVRLWRCCRCV